MPGDLRRISLAAVILLVLLRISIGWHLMYEGLWKRSTQHTSNPWTAEGYLKNATGPLRPLFRSLTGDPNDLLWLDHQDVTEKWNAWRERFAAHYGLDENQRRQLDRLLGGAESYSVALEALPPGIDPGNVDGIHKKAIRHDAKGKRLIVDGKVHLTPAERDKLIDLAEKAKAEATESKDVCDKFIKAVKDVYTASSRLGTHEQLAAVLKGDPERVGVIWQVKPTHKVPLDAEEVLEKDPAKDADTGTDKVEPPPHVVQVGELQYYRQLIKRFDANYAKARTKFEWDHVEKQGKDLQDLRRKLVGPVQAMEKEMYADAEELLSPEQLAAGPVPTPATPINRINWRTMWGLTILGLLLMLGLFTRLSALGAVALLSLFYLAMPPWPGVQEIPSIEHNLFVNKIWIEMLALLAIAALPSGKWFGLDAAAGVVFRRLLRLERKWLPW